MYKFGNNSRKHLDSCDPRLIEVAELVMSWQIYDFSIVWGHRGEGPQNQAYAEGNSNVEWPDSKHNQTPSPALDFAPYIHGIGVPWKDTHAFAVIGGLFIAAGATLGIPIVYGGDWDMDGETTDQRLKDWGHVELG